MKRQYTIQQLQEEFMAQLDRELNTRRMYQFCVQRFYRWLAINGRDATKPTKTDVLDYKRDLLTSKSIYTVDLYMNAVKTYFRFLSSEGIAENITTHIRNEKKPKRFTKEPLTIIQIRKLIDDIPTTGLINLRDRAIIHLLYFNGLRVCEANRIRIKDITPTRIMILGKGKRTKTAVMINDRTHQAIENYLSELPGELSTDTPLFQSFSYRNKYRTTQLTPGMISTMVKKRLEKSGLKKKTITAHSLRHSAGTHMIQQGKSLYDVTLFLRHSDTNTSRLYTLYAEEQKMEENPPQSFLEKYYEHISKVQ